MGLITVSALVLEREDGRVLTVRKRGTHAWMLPGGKPEPGESAAACAVREVQEELGLVIEAEGVALLGTFDSRAANEAGFALRATVFRAPAEAAARAAEGAIAVRAEIEAARWIDPVVGIDDATEAPLNRELVFPLLAAERARR